MKKSRKRDREAVRTHVPTPLVVGVRGGHCSGQDDVDEDLARADGVVRADGGCGGVRGAAGDGVPGGEHDGHI